MDSLQLRHIMPTASMIDIKKYQPELVKLMPQFDITNQRRKEHFIAQVAHESGCFQYVKELASGEAYDTGRLAIALGNTPEDDNDGQFYKGRGLIQLTGHGNYLKFFQWLGGAPDILKHPEMLEQPHLAVMVSCWFWHEHGLNDLADKDDLMTITRRINGGLNGLEQRRQYLLRAKNEVL